MLTRRSPPAGLASSTLGGVSSATSHACPSQVTRPPALSCERVLSSISGLQHAVTVKAAAKVSDKPPLPQQPHHPGTHPARTPTNPATATQDAELVPRPERGHH